jgi:hypothetical protein
MPRNTASKSGAGLSCGACVPASSRGSCVMPPIDSSQAPRAGQSRPSSCSWPDRIHSGRRPWAWASNTTTSCPSRASMWAQARPAGPAPTTATRLPVAAARVKGCGAGLSIRRQRQSAAGGRSHRPCLVGVRTHTCSHNTSVGQTRAHMPPSGLAPGWCIAAPRRLSSAMRSDEDWARRCRWGRPSGTGLNPQSSRGSASASAKDCTSAGGMVAK